jgi:hypothetical protein
MRATEYERIDSLLHERVQILANNAFGDLTFQPSFLDQGNKKRAGAGRNADGGVEREDGSLIGFAV